MFIVSGQTVNREYVYCIRTPEDEENQETQEILEEQLARQLSRDYMDLLCKWTPIHTVHTFNIGNMRLSLFYVILMNRGILGYF